jgi:hypothetical protein
MSKRGEPRLDKFLEKSTPSSSSSELGLQEPLLPAFWRTMVDIYSDHFFPSLFPLTIERSQGGDDKCCPSDSQYAAGAYYQHGSVRSDIPPFAPYNQHHANLGPECLRDIGLDKELHELSSKGDCMIHTRWCHSMAGEEYARIHSWGHAPERKASGPLIYTDIG